MSAVHTNMYTIWIKHCEKKYKKMSQYHSLNRIGVFRTSTLIRTIFSTSIHCHIREVEKNVNLTYSMFRLQKRCKFATVA